MFPIQQSSASLRRINSNVSLSLYPPALLPTLLLPNPPPPARIRPADETPFDPQPPARLPSVAAKPKKKKLFGEVSLFNMFTARIDVQMPDDDAPLSDGPLARYTLSRPTSPSGSRALEDWQETSRRLMHPRSMYSPPSPPRRQLPKIRDDAISRRNRSSNSSANSRDSSQEQSKPNSQPGSRSASQSEVPISHPMAATQQSVASAPSLLSNDSRTTLGNSTQESIIASPGFPPRVDTGRSLSFQLPRLASITEPANALQLQSGDGTSSGMKRRWSDDDSASKRDKSG